jgi:hypothetical protein
MSAPIFDRLCPFIADDAVLGKVSWNDRCGAFETAVSLWGTERVPFLLCAVDPIAQYEASLRRDRGARHLTSTPPPELAPACIERGNDTLPKLAALETVARAAAAKAPSDSDSLPPGKLHVGCVQVFSTHALVWFGSRDHSVCVKLDLAAGTASRTSGEAAKASAIFSRVPQRLLELPTRLHHPLLGDLTLSVRAAQYIGMKSEIVFRVDLGESISSKTLDASLEGAGALLQKVEPQYGDATERALTALRERRTERNKAEPTSVRLEWVALLERSEAMLFFQSEPKADDALSVTFDREGRLKLIEINTDDEPFEIEMPVAPLAAPASAPERVEHSKFGAGVVLERVEGEKVRVRFDDGSERTLLARVLSPKV